jgi:arylformamidase
MIYDVSMPLRDGMPFYTGSTPFKRVLTHELAKGQPVNESKLEMGAHNGTHVDAPLHFEKDGFSADAIPVENLVGPARLFHFPKRDCIDRADLENLDWRGVERVLFRTRNSDHWVKGGEFDPNFVYLTGAGAGFLVEKNVRLVGIDSLGIEQFGHKEHPAHHTLLRKGVTIVEGLYLADVPPGDYTLFCGPLRILGADGAPARVFLMS